MNEYLFNLFTRYKKRGILVDTNILLLYLAGSFSLEIIRDFSRTAMFSEDDFDRVSKFIDKFDIKITTPHILTEVSDLIGNRTELQEFLKVYLEMINEQYIESIKVVKNEAFIKFGLADTAILETSKDYYLILTDDKPFFGYLINKGIDAVSLDQVRMI
jgi:rRNA-processing protein FCF1